MRDPSKHPRRVIGLTGSVACGKSAVAAVLARMGVPIIDADAIAREVTASGSPCLARISAALGPEALSGDELNRAFVRQLVFADAGKRKKLESILHPEIRRVSQARIEKAFRAGHRVVIYEAPLLLEAGRSAEIPEILLVACDPATQRSRLLSRDKGLSAEIADQMIASQLPQPEKEKLATWVIRNDSTLGELEKKVRAWHANVLGAEMPKS